MKYSFWDRVFLRVGLKKRVEKLTEKTENLNKLLSERDIQLVKAIQVAKEWREKYLLLNEKVEKEKEELKDFLQKTKL